MRLTLVLLTCTILGFGSFAAEPKPSADLAAFDAVITSKDRQHWAFQPVTRSAVPEVKDAAWVRNPIDAFILAKLEASGWRPAEPAKPQAVLRRVYLDLIGLPPTIAEQDAYLRDPSPAALDRVIDDLLSRSTYGERWARHWLDLVRYAETNGYERDATKPHAWRYRDYVIRAFNDDKPFDRFILEQLAGDELADANGETMIATGYYRLGPWDDEPADPKEDRFDQLDDMVSTTAQVFLGLTLGCARCHNHKFEPLTQLDYYRMVAVFNPLQRPQNGRTELDLPIGSRSEIAKIADRDRAIENAHQNVRYGVLEILGYPFAPLAPTFVGSELITRSAERIAELKRHTPDLPRGYFMQEKTPTAPATHLLIRGSSHRPGPQVEPGVPAVLVTSQPSFLPLDDRTSYRRMSLAKWIASQHNPLTARVIVNRIWQHHFGEGLARLPSDFGTKAEPPTHPELLDWLAQRFVEDGWSIKKLHRLILTSNAYRMNKRWNEAYGEKDPENKLLWRMPYRRLEVEAIRDSMLAVSGQLNPKMYGPSMSPPVPKEALEGNSDPDKIWKASDEREASRRTIYAFIKRSMVVPLLDVLDLCDTARTSAQRVNTTVAPQALALFNSEFVNRQARYFAERLLKEAGDDPQKQIQRAYRLALCRPPTEKEAATMLAFLHRETINRRQALEQLCRVIFNLNEFVYAD